MSEGFLPDAFSEISVSSQQQQQQQQEQWQWSGQEVGKSEWGQQEGKSEWGQQEACGERGSSHGSSAAGAAAAPAAEALPPLPPPVPVAAHAPEQPPPFPEAVTSPCHVEQALNGWEVLVAEESGRMWQLIRSLRETIYGEVMLGIEFIRDGDGQVQYADKHSAIKISYESRMSAAKARGSPEDPFKEIGVMQFLEGPGGGGSQHANVLGLTAALRDSTTEGAEALYVVMPYCDGGELFDLVDQVGKYSEDDARALFGQVLRGTAYLQRSGVCHRDMSLENLLVDDGRVIIVIDFGMALRCARGKGEAPVLIEHQGTCGKRNYIAPEIWMDAPFNGFAVDVWACGIILFMLLTGFPPFDMPHPRDERFRIIAEQRRLAELLGQWGVQLSASVIDLLQKMLVADPSQRCAMSSLLSHPWVRQGMTKVFG